MSRTYHHGERRIRVRSVRRHPTDLRRLALALIELTQAQAEADAQDEHKKRDAGKGKNPRAASSRNLPRREAA